MEQKLEKLVPSENILIDSPPGSGKTTFAIELINDMHFSEKVIYITPLLTEVRRIKNECQYKNFKEPDVKRGRGRKANHLLSLIQEGNNIASTHALFSEITDEVINELRKQNYTLFLDESFTVIKNYDLFTEDEYKRKSEEELEKMTIAEVNQLLLDGILAVEADYRLVWAKETFGYEKYKMIRTLCERHMLYYINKTVLMWAFPAEVFKSVFTKVYVLTYQFEFQMQKSFYDYHGISYEKFHIEKIGGNYEMVKTVNNQYELDFINSIKDKLKFFEHSDYIFQDGYALSLRWYKRDVGKEEDDEEVEGDRIGTDKVKVEKISLFDDMEKNWEKEMKKGKCEGVTILKKALGNFFKNYSDNAKAKDVFWGTFDQFKKYLRSDRSSYATRVPMNQRATNEYRNKRVVAYMVNRFVRPHYLEFFEKRNIKVNEKGYALSEMLQFIFRGRIRQGESMIVYIPSSRMLKLIKAYLNGEMLS